MIEPIGKPQPKPDGGILKESQMKPKPKDDGIVFKKNLEKDKFEKQN